MWKSLLRGRSDEVNEKENRCFIGNLFTCTTIFLSVSAWAIEGEQQTERTQTQPKKQQKPVQVKQQKESDAHSIEQSSMTESSAITEKK